MTTIEIGHITVAVERDAVANGAGTPVPAHRPDRDVTWILGRRWQWSQRRLPSSADLVLARD